MSIFFSGTQARFVEDRSQITDYDILRNEEVALCLLISLPQEFGLLNATQKLGCKILYFSLSYTLVKSLPNCFHFVKTKFVVFEHKKDDKSRSKLLILYISQTFFFFAQKYICGYITMLHHIYF